MATSGHSSVAHIASARNDAPPFRRALVGSESLSWPRPQVVAGPWGWLPLLSLVSACGVLLVALAHSLARHDSPWAQTLYWTALVVLFVPAATRLIVPGVGRREALGILLWLGVATYLAKVLHSPLRFTFFDEFLHWRTAADILQSGRLFSENSLLPVSPLYPGLEIATVALVNLTGLSIFAAGVIVVGVARVVLVLAIYLFFEQLGGSVRLAGIATALYMGNPHFVIFDGQFAYESLALALAFMIVRALLRRRVAERGELPGLYAIVVIGLWSLVATHHATSYMTTLFLVLWAAVVLVANRWLGQREPGLIWVAALAVAVNITWLVCVSSITIGYLAPHLEGAITSVLNLIAGEGSDRELFKSNSGIPTPLLEKLTGLGAAGLIMGCLPFGLLAFWSHYRKNATAWALALASLSYPVTLVMRLTGGGWEISARSSVFVFFPLALVLSMGMLHIRLPWPLGRFQGLLERSKTTLFACFITVIFCGGIIAGWSPWARMPWPYRVGADTRSIEPQGLAAAAWANDHLGRNNRMAADRINMTLMGTYGGQRLITHLIDKVTISGIFLSSQLGPTEREIVQQGRIRYLLVDLRVSKGLPLDGHYYESWEKLVVSFSGPVNRMALDKFSTMPQVSQVFDSGDIKLYDIGALSRAP